MLQSIETALATSHDPFGLICAAMLVGMLAISTVGAMVILAIAAVQECYPTPRRRYRRRPSWSTAQRQHRQGYH